MPCLTVLAPTGSGMIITVIRENIVQLQVNGAVILTAYSRKWQCIWFYIEIHIIDPFEYVSSTYSLNSPRIYRLDGIISFSNNPPPLSLSLFIYIYIYICVCVYIYESLVLCWYAYNCIFDQALFADLCSINPLISDKVIRFIWV